MLKALYDYGLRRLLTLPPGFIEKTVKAYISLSEDNDRVSIYLAMMSSCSARTWGALRRAGTNATFWWKNGPL